METQAVTATGDFPLICYLFVLVIGCISALAELLSRYNYALSIFKYKESYVYLLINGGTALLAYFIIDSYKINLGPFTAHKIGTVLTAGLSSMVVLRSSFSSIKIGGKTVDVGIAPILQVFLNSADRAFDQSRSRGDLEQLSRLMTDIDAEKAQRELPLLCTNILQNVPKEDLQKMINDISKVFEPVSTSNYSRSLNIGIILNRITGFQLLKAAVESLKKEISISKSESQKDDSINQLQLIEIEKLKSLFKDESLDQGEQ